MSKYQDGVNRKLRGKVVDRVEDRFGDGLLVWFEDGEFMRFTSSTKHCPYCDEAVTDNDVDYDLCVKGNK